MFFLHFALLRVTIDSENHKSEFLDLLFFSYSPPLRPSDRTNKLVTGFLNDLLIESFITPLFLVLSQFPFISIPFLRPLSLFSTFYPEFPKGKKVIFNYVNI